MVIGAIHVELSLPNAAKIEKRMFSHESNGDVVLT
jgi:hypothetical protein